jgi:hypothetical protein
MIVAGLPVPVPVVSRKYIVNEKAIVVVHDDALRVENYLDSNIVLVAYC